MNDDKVRNIVSKDYYFIGAEVFKKKGLHDEIQIR